MMTDRGQAVTSLARPASMTGEILVEEYGYGLGPPTGILVLRYPPMPALPDFPESRDDFLHQLFWSPDGVLCVRRGDTTRYLSPGAMAWIRRGVVAEVHGLDSQTVIRACVRQAPRSLTARAAATIEAGEQAAATLLTLARPGVHEDVALRARARVLDSLAASPAEEIGHTVASPSPARSVTRALLRDPADPTGLNGWAEQLHVSAKTLQRDFEREFGMPFTAWRTRIRMNAAVALLHGQSVTETAHRVGYASASAFVAAFTREFGTTPGRFLTARAAS